MFRVSNKLPYAGAEPSRVRTDDLPDPGEGLCDCRIEAVVHRVGGAHELLTSLRVLFSTLPPALRGNCAMNRTSLGTL